LIKGVRLRSKGPWSEKRRRVLRRRRPGTPRQTEQSRDADELLLRVRVVKETTRRPTKTVEPYDNNVKR
jgi:hypothetical protein